MALWFAGMSLVVVWAVFRDPTLDHRLVMVGAVVPDLLDSSLGGPQVFHTVLASACLLVLVMVFTRGRRALRRHLLALPIGTFLHLVLDGAWAATGVFWWPFSGEVLDGPDLPSIERGWANLPLEVVGGVALWWAWRRFGLSDPARRRRFLRTGQLDPALVS